MDPKIAFWGGALALMATMAALVASGVRAVRRGDIALHRRRMLTAAALVGLFLATYVAKVLVLGHEALDTWEAWSRGVLRVHESFIACLLLGGTSAASLAWRFRGTRVLTARLEDPPAPAALRRWHRRAGWTAAVGAAGGVLTAALLLAGMLRRAAL